MIARRWWLRLGVLAVGAAVGTSGATTLAAWTDTETTPSGTVSSAPDWTPPAITSARIVKSQGGTPNFVKPSGKYRSCAQVEADTGNPASGTQSVTANVSTLTAGATSQALAAGAASPCLVTDNRDSGELTADAGAASGTVTVTATDAAANASASSFAVRVDGTAPAPVSFSTANAAGGMVGLPESGDTVTFTFSEPIDPHSVVPGWDGSATTAVYAYVVNAGAGGKSDRLQIQRSDGAGGYVQVPLTPTSGFFNYVFLQRNYVTANVRFAASMARTADGNGFTVTFGTPDSTSVRQDTASDSTVWYTDAALFDRAGNALPATSITDAAGQDF